MLKLYYQVSFEHNMDGCTVTIKSPLLGEWEWANWMNLKACLHGRAWSAAMHVNWINQFTKGPYLSWAKSSECGGLEWGIFRSNLAARHQPRPCDTPLWTNITHQHSLIYVNFRCVIMSSASIHEIVNPKLQKCSARRKHFCWWLYSRGIEFCMSPLWSTSNLWE